jgi:hypothetical protein
MKKYIVILCLTFISAFSFSQEQNNTPGSDFFIDVPTRINISNNTSIPITVYVHESECTNCQNYLNYIDISMKCASAQQFGNPITFHSLTYNQFINLFDSYSVNDNTWSEQSFIDSKPLNVEDHSILFTADTNMWIPPIPVVPITKHYFYFNFNIPYNYWSQYLCNDSVVDLHIYVSLDYDIDAEFWFRVFVYKDDFPQITNWYRGDTHFHSYFTQNLAENGFPLKSSKAFAKTIGLDWITITDHSCDYDNYGISMTDNWAKQANEISNLNSEDNTFIFIRAIEASINNSQNKIVHSLVYPNPEEPFSMPYFFDGGGDASSTNITIDNMLDSLNKYNGFAYAAHPFSEGDKLSSLVNGDVWNIADNLSPQNGSAALSVGNVIWNNLSAPSDIYSTNPNYVFKNNLIGLQNWNLWYTLSSNTDTDPWNTQYNAEPYGFSEVPTNDYLHTMYRFTQNMEAYSFLLRRGLKMKNQNHNINNWKLFLSAGSDAHGSFNYSNTDYVYGGVSGYVENNYPGALNTLVYCPNGMGTNGKNILKGLKSGHSILSSGPIIVMTITSPLGFTLPGDDIDISTIDANNVIINLKAISNKIFGTINNAYIILETQDNSYSYTINISNGNFSISLADLLNNMFSMNNMPINQYFAIRAYLETNKIYTGNQSTLHKKQSETFYSLTNPIWIKSGNWDLVNNYNASNIKLYPNPTSNILYVNGIDDKPIRNIYLISPNGATINMNFFKKINTIELNLNELPTGVYILKIIFDDGIYVDKIIKF